MHYTFKVLGNKEFDVLDYPDAGESLGIADPKTNTAYIRHTAWPDLNKYLIQHEFEHLLGENTSHFENGVYYKKLKDVFKVTMPIGASFIPGVGPIAGPALGAYFAQSDAKKAQKRALAEQQSQAEAQQSELQNVFSQFQQQQQQPTTVFPQQRPPTIGGGFGEGALTGQGPSFGGGFGGGGSIIDRLRAMLGQKASGFYAGRDPLKGVFY
mgnify:FL=1